MTHYRRRPHYKLIILLLAAIAALGYVNVRAIGAKTKAPAPVVVRHDRLPLHAGSHGPNVIKLQRLLAGKGWVFHDVKPLFKHAPNGLYGTKTAEAVFATKYRLGYPPRYLDKANPTAGPDFFAILTGKKHRSLEMVALAARRLQAVAAGMTDLAFSIKKIELSQLGAHEIPDNSNCGPQIDKYFAYFHFGCGLAWCEFFQEWAFGSAGYRPMPFSTAPFLVVASEHYWLSKGWVSAKAKPGSLVTFLDDGGHIGYVVKVMAAGYVTIEGNSANMVQQVYHPWNQRLRVFIWLPGVT